MFNDVFFYHNLYPLYVVPHIAIDFVFVLDIVILYFLAIMFRRYATVCNSSSDVAIKIWSSAYSIVFTNVLLFSYMPFFITVLNSCITLLMYILNNTGERSHPCLTPLFQCSSKHTNCTFMSSLLYLILFLAFLHYFRAHLVQP